MCSSSAELCVFLAELSQSWAEEELLSAFWGGSEVPRVALPKTIVKGCGKETPKPDANFQPKSCVIAKACWMLPKKEPNPRQSWWFLVAPRFECDRTGKSRKTHSVAQSSESIKAVINQCRPDLMLEAQSSLATMFLLPVCKCFDSRESYLFTAARGSFAFVFLIHHISTMVVTESFPSKYVRVHVD